MGNMIGKSGINWANAPEGATHYINLTSHFYKKFDGRWVCTADKGVMWTYSECSNESILKWAISKKEDLEMGKIKVVKSIEDLEVGMFIISSYEDKYLVLVKNSEAVHGIRLDNKVNFTCTYEGYNLLKSWSYTYDGEYTPIIKESEEDKRIKELQNTIDKAQATLAEAQEQIKRIKGE